VHCINTYKNIQQICKQVMSDSASAICVGKSESEILHASKSIINAHGIKDFWYHNIPVMVAIGEQTLISMSGKNLTAGNAIIQTNDFITIDLSLGIENHWGIYAKSFAIEDGILKGDNFNNDELRELKFIVDSVHKDMMRIAVPEMSFHDLYHEMTNYVNSYNVVQLDFRNNFGHSIEKHLDDRIYIEHSQMMKLGEKNIFSFEPHIRFKNGKYGFKYADIYYFEASKVCSLSD
jgi:methionine aminopeptidase